MSEELKPCPFCGGIAAIEHQTQYLSATVMCGNPQCPVIIEAAGHTDEEAIALWNRRTERQE